MSYLLHYAPDNASLIVRVALDHLELPFDTALVDRAARAQESASYRRLNPMGLIPVLETPEGPIAETAAILLWLTDRHGRLGPSAEAPERGNFLQWLFYLSNTLHSAERMLFYPDKYIAPDHRRPLWEGLQAHLRGCFALLDRQAAENPLFAPGSPGALHFYLAGLLRWPALYPAASDRSWFQIAHYPALERLCLAIEDLPCTRALQKAEGLGRRPFSDPVKPNPPEGSAT